MIEKESKLHDGLCILTINGGSPSIKFALFQVKPALQRILEGAIERIGLPVATFVVTGSNKDNNFAHPITVPNHSATVNVLMDWIEKSIGQAPLIGVGHRVVHGGPKYSATVSRRI